MTNPIETGVVVAALSIVMIALKIVDHMIARRRNGLANGKRATVIECPNKVYALTECMHNLEVNCGRTASAAIETKAGVETLVKQHGAVDGIEQWKFTPILRQQVATAVRQLGETLALQQRQLELTEKMVLLQSETVVLLKRNGKKSD